MRPALPADSGGPEPSGAGPEGLPSGPSPRPRIVGLPEDESLPQSAVTLDREDDSRQSPVALTWGDNSAQPAVALARGEESPLLAAPVAEVLALVADKPGSLVHATLSGGGCFVRPLPIDTTCAAAARRFFREALASLPIPAGLLHDGVTMASELAANTLHAQRSIARAAAARHRVPAGIPEIWLYLRGNGGVRELVCKVFDTERNWDAGPQPGMTAAPADSISGRGLQVVAGLSAGQWGCHLSRSRLGNWRVPGKAVWFALRLPSGVLPEHVGRPRYSEEWLTDELEIMLAERGLGGGIVRADMNGTSVLSLSRHLTVWRHGDQVSWRAQDGSYKHQYLGDVVDVAEQIVCAHEEAMLDETGVPEVVLR